MSRMFRSCVCAGLSFLVGSSVFALPPANYRPESDWLVDGSGFEARVGRDEALHQVVLSNGLVRRVFRVGPGFSTVGYDNLATGESLIRAIRPDARVVIDGREHVIGGMTGQPNHAFFTGGDLDAMGFDPAAMHLVGVEEGKPVARFAWKRVRHHAPDAEWPPPGVSLRFDFAPSAVADTGLDSAAGRESRWDDLFEKLDPAWKVSASSSAERVSFENEGKPGEIYAPGNVHCFAERVIPADTALVEARIHPGTDQGTSWGPGMAVVFGKQLVEVNLRPGDRGEHGHFELRVGGAERLAKVPELAATDGGLSLEHGYRLRVRIEPGHLFWEVSAEREGAEWHAIFEVKRKPGWGAPGAVRVGKTDRGGGASDQADLAGEWGRCRIGQVSVFGPLDPAKLPKKGVSPLRVSLHYELYDGIPLMMKWLTVENRGKKAVTVDRFTAETLALVEHSNHVETRDGVPLPQPRGLHVETDMAFGSFNHDQANRHAVHYRPDPQFATQVNWARKQPCLLVVEPTRGPAQSIAPGARFESFRVFELAMDSTGRERRGLALRRMYRTVAPWVTENPLMHHMRNAKPDQVRRAIDQAAEVGFEMVILSFGSGFNAENDAPAHLAQWKEVAEYATSKGIDLGCYSLYSSRRIGGGNDIVCPEGERPTHGNCPAITSEWGQAYLKKLYTLFEQTGFTIFENDGPYPGDVDITARPPLQKGIDDSRWVHWRQWAGFYQWLRGRGVYINAPDYYYLSGSNKCGMGYRETNWSLPRAQQLIHTRQNIHDGTWTKTPSMGWMFVPLSQYHGGGAAATIEPLDTHIDHYERMMLSNLALGVQACYRGPRLYDTPRVRDMVKGRVAWFKQHRDILESDVLHLKRADGRTLDGMLHVNPQLDEKAMLVVFNPTERPLKEHWVVPLHYAGLSGKAKVSINGGPPREVALDGLRRTRLELKVPAGGFLWAGFSE